MVAEPVRARGRHRTAIIPGDVTCVRMIATFGELPPAVVFTSRWADGGAMDTLGILLVSDA
jgi:hypothetical protein